MNKALYYYCCLKLYILCVTYFLTSISVPDPQTSDMRQIYTVNDVSASSDISSP